MYLDDLKISLNNNKAVIGSSRTIKYLKEDKLKLIVLAKNCPENIKMEIENFSKKHNVKVENFDGMGKQLGIYCGKPFSISAISILK